MAQLVSWILSLSCLQLLLFISNSRHTWSHWLDPLRSSSLHSPFSLHTLSPQHSKLPSTTLASRSAILDAGYSMETECLPIVATCSVYKTPILYGLQVDGCPATPMRYNRFEFLFLISLRPCFTILLVLLIILCHPPDARFLGVISIHRIVCLCYLCVAHSQRHCIPCSLSCLPWLPHYVGCLGHFSWRFRRVE